MVGYFVSAFHVLCDDDQMLLVHDADRNSQEINEEHESSSRIEFFWESSKESTKSGS